MHLPKLEKLETFCFTRSVFNENEQLNSFLQLIKKQTQKYNVVYVQSQSRQNRKQIFDQDAFDFFEEKSTA